MRVTVETQAGEGAAMTGGANGGRGATVRAARADDRAAWGDLYAAYAAFYEAGQTEAQRDRVWGWAMDAAQPFGILVIVDGNDEPVGFGHWRTFLRPLAGSVGLYLDDFYLDPGARGGGGAAALLAELRAMARREGYSVVRWITADDNYRARALYDRVATRTAWVTYDMAPDAD
jgi:GNAT superfamily N-acetyltransferase